MRGARFYCNYCRELKIIEKGKDEPTRDHFLPKSKGGGMGKVNMVLCCRQCNTLKGNQVFNSIEDVQKYILGCNMRNKKKKKELEEHPNGIIDNIGWKGCG